MHTEPSVGRRIHLTVSTPYTYGIACLIGARLFLKLYEPHETAWEKLVIVADAGLLQVMCIGGVVSQFYTTSEGYAGVLILVFVSITAARVAHLVCGRVQ